LEHVGRLKGRGTHSHSFFFLIPKQIMHQIPYDVEEMFLIYSTSTSDPTLIL